MKVLGAEAEQSLAGAQMSLMFPSLGSLAVAEDKGSIKTWPPDTLESDSHVSPEHALGSFDGCRWSSVARSEGGEGGLGVGEL